jgi:oxygen-dependent protoporphyrinogen oxidase
MRRTFVLNRGRPTPLPDGVQMIVPTQFMPFALSPLLSPLAKLRMGMDFFIPPKRDGKDETLAEFITRRLGREALDKIAEPMMSGIYNAEAERQSLLATFPRFRELEEKHGSLIRGMLAARRGNGTAPLPDHGAKPPSMFVSLRAGTQELVETLTAQLTGDLRLKTGVEHIARCDEGGYRLSLDDGTQLDAAVVILTTPAYVAGALLRNIAPQAADQLRAIRYVSTGTLSLAFRRAEIAHPLDGFGLLIPRSEKRPINAITWTSTKFDHRAPADHVLLRVFFGGSRSREMMDRDDDTLLEIVRRETKALMGIEAAPMFHRIYRWHKANPQYDAGHLDRVSAIENNLPPGVYVTGSAYRGIGIPDCVHQAQQTIQQVLRL